MGKAIRRCVNRWLTRRHPRDQVICTAEQLARPRLCGRSVDGNERIDVIIVRPRGAYWPARQAHSYKPQILSLGVAEGLDIESIRHSMADPRRVLRRQLVNSAYAGRPMTTPNADPKPLPVLAVVAAVLLLAGALAAVIVFGRMKHDPAHAADSATSPTPAADSPGKEAQFLRRLEVQNLQLDRSDAAAVKDAHYVCGRYLGGEGKDQIVQDILQGSPGMSVDTATDFADTAIDVYCPDGHQDDPT